MGICNGRAGDLAKRDGPRNVVTWDFKRSLVCDDEEVKQTWNFKDVVDAKTRTFAAARQALMRRLLVAFSGGMRDLRAMCTLKSGNETACSLDFGSACLARVYRVWEAVWHEPSRVSGLQ